MKQGFVEFVLMIFRKKSYGNFWVKTRSPKTWGKSLIHFGDFHRGSHSQHHPICHVSFFQFLFILRGSTAKRSLVDT